VRSTSLEPEKYCELPCDSPKLPVLLNYSNPVHEEFTVIRCMKNCCCPKKAACVILIDEGVFNLRHGGSGIYQEPERQTEVREYCSLPDEKRGPKNSNKAKERGGPLKDPPPSLAKT
jgi:hypothetical protein